jgi:hypothetical protein
MGQTRVPATWARRWALFGAGACAAVALLGPAASAQQQPDPSIPALTLPDNPLEPSGRAVCNVAFSLTSAIGLTSFVVPPDAPLGPNDVIVALHPILQTCVGLFPPARARRCATADLYPSTGLPLTLPDPGGILTEQVEALAAVLDPLGLVLAGPLHDLFVAALRCQDATAPAGSDPAPAPLEEGLVDAPASEVPPAGAAVTGPPSLDLPSARDLAVAPPAPSRDGSPRSLASALPAPLQGGTAAAVVLAAAAGALALRRLLAPRRESSLLERSRPR